MIELTSKVCDPIPKPVIVVVVAEAGSTNGVPPSVTTSMESQFPAFVHVSVTEDPLGRARQICRSNKSAPHTSQKCFDQL